MGSAVSWVASLCPYAHLRHTVAQRCANALIFLMLLALLAATTGYVSAPATPGTPTTAGFNTTEPGSTLRSTPLCNAFSLLEAERVEPGPDGSKLCEICLGYPGRTIPVSPVTQFNRVGQSGEMCLREQVMWETMRGTSIYPRGLTTTVDQHNLQEMSLLEGMSTTEIGLLTLICVVLSLIPSRFCHSRSATLRKLVETLHRVALIAALASGGAVTVARTTKETGLRTRRRAAASFKPLLCRVAQVNQKSSGSCGIRSAVWLFDWKIPSTLLVFRTPVLVNCPTRLGSSSSCSKLRWSLPSRLLLVTVLLQSRFGGCARTNCQMKLWLRWFVTECCQMDGRIRKRSLVQRLFGGICREIDIAARVGGEEFALLLPGIDVEAAAVVAERVRATIEDLGVEHPHPDHKVVTISLGVAATSPARCRGEILIVKVVQPRRCVTSTCSMGSD